MGDNKGAFNFNEDGSIDIPIDEKPVRFVKESDLLAVKSSATQKAQEWEKEKTQFSTQVTEATKLREESHQSLLKLQAETEQKLAKYGDYDALKTRVGELDKTIGSHKESVGKLEKELTDRIKLALIGYGATEDVIKDKSLDQLRNLEDAAKIFGNKGKQSARYDNGGGNGQAAVSQLDRAKGIIAKAEEKRRAPLKVSNAGVQ